MKRSPLAPNQFPSIPAIDGVRLSAVATGVKYQGRPDLMLAVFSTGTRVAGVLTQSKMASAPVEWCRKALKNGHAEALIVNAGNANAFTGKVGMDHTRSMADTVSAQLSCSSEDVFVASTGVIGEQLPCDRITDAVPHLIGNLSETAWQEAARSIKTTDTYNKAAYRECIIEGQLVKLAGIAKGSGMIAPDMATLLVFVFTDAGIETDLLQSMLQKANETTFNCITVDSDTSTSDTLLIFATGQSGVSVDVGNNEAAQSFSKLLQDLLQDLAIQVVRDGEGASKLITIDIHGAESDHSARRIGLAVANSPLVKTAIAGQDANWGRIVMAVGKAGEPADQNRLKISMGGVLIAEKGLRVPHYDEEHVNEHLQGSEVLIQVDLGIASGRARVWTCDLTHGYISINADYRS